jgi:hypothetical protein
MPVLEERGVRFTYQERRLDALPREIVEDSLPVLAAPATAPVALERTA